MEPHKDSFVMVAAIDFGTTFSGYAFSFTSGSETIFMNKNWGADVGFASYKNPTCVLLNPSEEFDSFGYEAENKYGAIVEEGTNSNGWAVFRHFKMALHKADKKSGKLSRSKTLVSSSGSLMPALTIFTMALKFLKNHLIDAVGKHTGSRPDDSMIRWVITVPAIWSEESKQFMREVALEAGFIKSMDSKQLVIALEPEAASLYCRRLDVSQFLGKTGPISFTTGVKYLVIDSGGGTVDVTVHEILDNNKVKELHAATGGAWGGTKVDDNFVKLISEALGERFVKVYQEECPQQWLQLMVNFEKVKRAAKPDGKSTMNIQLAWAMGNKYAEVNQGKNIVQALNNSSHLGVSFNNGMLIINYDAVKEMFEPVLKNITDHIEGLLKKPKLEQCHYFFLVGGFSESEFLQKAIKDKFGSVVDVLVPSEAQMCVIKGAVLFGHNPVEIKSRIARKTYGCKVLKSFDPSIHKESKKQDRDGKLWCTDIFSPFVEEGEEVEVDSVRRSKHRPVKADQDGMDFKYYCLDGIPKDVQYIDDSSMQQLGSLHVNMPDLKGGRQREVEVSITFGGTEIQIDAIDVTTKNKAETKLNFLAS